MVTHGNLTVREFRNIIYFAIGGIVYLGLFEDWQI